MMPYSSAGRAATSQRSVSQSRAPSPCQAAATSCSPSSPTPSSSACSSWKASTCPAPPSAHRHGTAPPSRRCHTCCRRRCGAAPGRRTIRPRPPPLHKGTPPLQLSTLCAASYHCLRRLPQRVPPMWACALHNPRCMHCPRQRACDPAHFTAAHDMLLQCMLRRPLAARQAGRPCCCRAAAEPVSEWLRVSAAPPPAAPPPRATLA